MNTWINLVMSQYFGWRTWDLAEIFTILPGHWKTALRSKYSAVSESTLILIHHHHTSTQMKMIAGCSACLSIPQEACLSIPKNSKTDQVTWRIFFQKYNCRVLFQQLVPQHSWTTKQCVFMKTPPCPPLLINSLSLIKPHRVNISNIKVRVHIYHTPVTGQTYLAPTSCSSVTYACIVSNRMGISHMNESWCVRCLLITKRPKTPCHYRYQI